MSAAVRRADTLCKYLHPGRLPWCLKGARPRPAQRAYNVAFGSFATMAVEATASRMSASLPKADN
jgi:hypothetical protein